MKLANEDLSRLNLYLWEQDERRIRFVTQDFHEEEDCREAIQINKEELVDYIGITYNK